MAFISKRKKMINEAVVPGTVYDLDAAFGLIKKVSTCKFDETVTVAIVLGIDARKSDQLVRGATTLPNGTGKTVRVAVFAQGAQAAAALEAGADIVGFEDLAEKVKGGQMDFDVVIATPDAMRIVGQLGQILGPRGLMPNPKVGTVTPDAATAVRNAKSGQARFRTDKGGIIHAAIGKVSFTPQALKENLAALVADVKKLKPSTSKGIYLKKMVVSSTMGPGLVVDHSPISST